MRRLSDIAPYLADPGAVPSSLPLHRVTVFLTYACNLACPYCKTIVRSDDDLRRFPQKADTFTYELFAEYLTGLEAVPVHVHFTGGEAALVAELPRMVRLASDRGVRHLSITSNGTVPLKTFEGLVAAGLSEIRISIDAHEATLGAILTGRAHAWQRVVKTIDALAALRSGGNRVFLIANTVVNEMNRTHVVDIVRFLIDRGVDDIKLITVVDRKDSLGDFPGAVDLLRKIEAMLQQYPADAFPLLRRKLQTVFSSQAIGLDVVRAPRDSDWRCYVPMSERTVDARYYYPCSVYLREGGRPLGRIQEPQHVQREKTADFVQNGRCLDDPICRTYCLHCTKIFNVAANEARERANGGAPE